MTVWTLHWLEAEGSLAAWRDAIAREIEAAEAAVARLVSPPRLDLLIARRSPRDVMAEDGLGGFAHSPYLLSLSCDPENPGFEASLANGALCRAAVHEVHHCLRMASVGYGETLGEALVTEGLAGHFVSVALGSPLEPWERAVPRVAALAFLPDEAGLASTDYDHAAWFFGTGDLPRWLGYSLGRVLVEEWAARVRPVGRAWIDTPAREILRTTPPD